MCMSIYMCKYFNSFIKRNEDHMDVICMYGSLPTVLPHMIYNGLMS